MGPMSLESSHIFTTVSHWWYFLLIAIHKIALSHSCSKAKHCVYIPPSLDVGCITGTVSKMCDFQHIKAICVPHSQHARTGNDSLLAFPHFRQPVGSPRFTTMWAWGFISSAFCGRRQRNQRWQNDTALQNLVDFLKSIQADPHYVAHIKNTWSKHSALFFVSFTWQIIMRYMLISPSLQILGIAFITKENL